MKKAPKLLGKIAISPKGTGYVEIEGFEEDIEVDARHLNTALNGDEVEIKLHPKRSNKRQSGEVTHIISRAKNGFAGVLMYENSTYFVRTDDVRMYADIIIPKNSLGNAKVKEKVFVKITSWKDRNSLPQGEITKVFGHPGENNAEMLSIAMEKGFDSDFPKEVESEAKKIKERGIREEDFKGRRDFRNTLTFTIDPDNAKDFDDALSFKKVGNDFEIGVHIADVTHYVRPGSAIEREAKNRGTSVYLVDRTIPMLPEVLSNDLCSLVPHQDRLVMSAVFIMDKNGEIKDEWYGRAIINSQRRFTYAEAEESIHNERGELHRELKTLNDLAKKMTKERIALGALTLDQEEVKFVLDDKGTPLKVTKKTMGDSNKLIEEFMLLANRKVAELISAKKKGKKTDRVFVYRIHDLPSKEKMADLHFFLKSLGYKVTLKDGLIPTSEINKILESLKGKGERDSVHRVVIRSMAKAIYSTKNIGHYGLAFEYYTHFTSPIRRYPDMLVHRFLMEFLAGKKTDKNKIKEWEKITRESSDQEKRAADAERSSVKYKQVEYMSSRIGQIFDGVISGVSEWGLFIEELETKCEGLVRSREMTDDFYILNEKSLELVGQKKHKKYRIGDKVRVKVSKVDLERKTIDYLLA